MSFDRTRLYSEAFLQDNPGFTPEEQNFFKQQFLSMRARVEPLVGRILRDMPGYTVHDITHLDALWETASLVAGDHITLNPPEAFVFGGAILLHDASMSLAAYAGGLAELKQSVEWKDLAAISASKGNGTLDEGFVTTNVLRLLHAKNAEKLAIQGWPSPNASPSTEFLIQDNEIRRFYGPAIGQIAHSHWWPITAVANKLNGYLGPLPPYAACEVDRLKLACLLRVADAIHLDRRRAPPFVRALDAPHGISDLHWAFQSRLSFPRIEGDALQFTAGEPCPIEESQSWWLGFDALTLADKELRETDLLLKSERRHGLKVRRIKGIQDPRELAMDVPVIGWKPVNSPLRISDVPKIITILGGSKLYGDDWRAPLRELLQNAVDAIQARRLLQGNTEWGLINVKLEMREGSSWLIVEDDGVGMSEHILTNSLVDFGSSLWRSASVSEEFPGLAARGMSAIGRFGIGFFSVFMIASEVRVSSRRFDAATTDALKLLFQDGVHSRPILAPAQLHELPSNGGTRIELKLFSNPQKTSSFKFTMEEPSRSASPFQYYEVPAPEPVDLVGLVKQIAPCCDTLVKVSDHEHSSVAIQPMDWITCSPQELCGRVVPVVSRPLERNLSTLVRPITGSNGDIIGRASIWPSHSYQSQIGALTSGGFKIQMLPHIAGVVSGDVEVAARNMGSPVTDEAAFRDWATEQANLFCKTKIEDETKAYVAEIVMEFEGNCGHLPIISLDGEWYNTDSLRTMLATLVDLTVLLGEPVHDDDDDVSQNSFDDLELENNIFLIPTISSGFSFAATRQWTRPSRILRHFEAILAEEWGENWQEIDDHIAIGSVGSTDIYRNVSIYKRN